MELYKCIGYQRVSTLNEEQAESCEHQKMLIDDYIDKHSEMVLVENYCDNGISGKTDCREDYSKMIQRVMQGDIDYILVKDSYRLCRSSEVNAALNRILIQTNTKIIYMADKSTYDPNNRQERLFNGIKALLGEDYVYQQSEAGKIYHMQKCMNKIINANNVTFGYFWDYNEKEMKINPEEAKVVEQIFEWYVYEDLGVSEIARRLGEKGIRGKKSKNLLTPRTLNQWLTNSAYKGILCFNKRHSILGVGSNAKTIRVDNPESEWVRVPCPAIISEELFDLAQKIREERNHTYNNKPKEVTRSYFSGFHTFASKLFCGDCGTQFQFGYTDRNKQYPLYYDAFSKRSKMRVDECCPNMKFNKIYERTLEVITRKSFNLLLENKENIFSQLLSLIKETMNEETEESSKVRIWNTKIMELEERKNKLLESWFQAPDIDTKEFCLREKDKCVNEIKHYTKLIEDSKVPRYDTQTIESQILSISEYLNRLTNVEDIDREFVDTFLNRIEIFSNGKIYVSFKFSDKKATTTLPDYKEEKLAIQKGLPSIHIFESLKELLFFGRSVRKIGGRGTMVRSAQGMLTRLKICWRDWRQWCLWEWICHWQQYADR